MRRRQRPNLGPLLVPKLRPDDTVQPGPNRLAGLVDEHAGVVVEAHDAAVWPLVLLRRAHHAHLPRVAASDLVGSGRRHAAAGTALGAKRALLLDDDNDAIAL